MAWREDLKQRNTVTYRQFLDAESRQAVAFSLTGLYKPVWNVVVEYEGSGLCDLLAGLLWRVEEYTCVQDLEALLAIKWADGTQHEDTIYLSDTLLSLPCLGAIQRQLVYGFYVKPVEDYPTCVYDDSTDAKDVVVDIITCALEGHPGLNIKATGTCARLNAALTGEGLEVTKMHHEYQIHLVSKAYEDFMPFCRKNRSFFQYLSNAARRLTALPFGATTTQSRPRRSLPGSTASRTGRPEWTGLGTFGQPKPDLVPTPAHPAPRLDPEPEPLTSSARPRPKPRACPERRLHVDQYFCTTCFWDGSMAPES